MWDALPPPPMARIETLVNSPELIYNVRYRIEKIIN
jgi:hypothetical protein